MLAATDGLTCGNAMRRASVGASRVSVPVPAIQAFIARGTHESRPRYTWPCTAVRATDVAVTVVCEPTGHRWRVVGQLAADRGCRSCACSRRRPRPRAGRLRLRVATWRAVWGCLRDNRAVPPATGSDQVGDQPAQAHPGPDHRRHAIMRQLHAVITTAQVWDPHIAAHGQQQRCHNMGWMRRNRSA